jgi:peroxiredoxin
VTTTNPLPANRRQFLILLAIFVLPLVTAYLVFYAFPGLRPTHTTNYGQLVEPARPLPAFDLRDADGKPADPKLFQGKWSMVYIAPADCADSCRKAVYLSRQVRTALALNARRVQRVYIAPDPASLAAARARFAVEHPDLLLLADAGAASRAAAFFQPAVPDALYMVDPLGNWFMVYPPNADPDQDFKGILKDLKKLLNQSQVD